MNLDCAVDSRRDEMIQDLQALVGIESLKGPACPGAPFGHGIRNALDFALAKGRALGFTVKDVDGYAGHVEFGGGGELVAVLAHLDVVPPGDGWSYAPFGGEIAANRLYGRGAMDDKGPVIACLHALAALRASGFNPRRRIRLILGCDEENTWECVSRYFADEEKPLYGFTPDAEFPLVVAEKGQLGLELRRIWSAGGEASIRVLAVHGGTQRNVVPDRCEAVLVGAKKDLELARQALAASGQALSITCNPEKLTIAAAGIAAHASRPQNGKNAIGRLTIGLASLSSQLPKEQAALIRFLADRIGLSYNGGGLGLAFKDEISGALTLNLGTIAWDETGVSLDLDIRYPLTANGPLLRARLAKKATAVGLETIDVTHLPPLYVSETHPLVAKLLAVYKDKTGQEARPKVIGGRTYACAIGTGVAFGPLLPGRPEVAHQPNEHIDLDDLMLCARIYAGAMVAMAVD